MRQNKNSPRPHSAPFRRSHTKSELDADPIKGYKIFKKPPADSYYNKYMVALRSLVEDNMKEFENNYFDHTFGLSSHSHKGES